MDKNDLVELMNEIFKPLGYKKKGNYWISKGEALTKSVYLQKSNFSKLYYINYGFIINHLTLTTTHHVFYRLSGGNANLLDLESNMNKERRLVTLKSTIEEKITNKLEAINTEAELLQEIQRLPFLSMIPVVVKNYFGLPIG